MSGSGLLLKSGRGSFGSLHICIFAEVNVDNDRAPCD